MKKRAHHFYSTPKNVSTLTLLSLFLLLTVLFIQACTHEVMTPMPPEDMEENPNETPCDPEVIYFDRDILPILKSNCAKSGCHDVASHQEGIILDNFQNVMASGIVKPFDLDDSEIYEVITETDPDKIMPEPPNQMLTANQIALIAQWIEQGAQSLTCDDGQQPCIAENISYAAFVAPLLSANCTGCHSGGSPSGNIVLNSHSAVQTVALNGRLLGAITWANGYQQMPQGSGKLSNCNIDKIKEWINNGAPNN
jgi:mono/diheme cytochrome c family protein